MGLALLGLGCPTTYVTLGDDDANAGTTGGAAGVAGMIGGYGSVGGTGGVGGTAGAAGVAGMVAGLGGYGGSAGSAGGAGIFGVGGAGGAAGVSGTSGSCAPSQETLNNCAPYASERPYDYHGCLNQNEIWMGQGVGGAPGALCSGYLPCSYQHEGCLYYQTSGAAGSNAGCAGAPGDQAWLEDCGGEGYYGAEIIGGTGGGGAGGSGGSAGGAGAGTGGATGMGGVGGEPVGGASGAGMGGEAGG